MTSNQGLTCSHDRQKEKRENQGITDRQMIGQTDTLTIMRDYPMNQMQDRPMGQMENRQTEEWTSGITDIWINKRMQRRSVFRWIDNELTMRKKEGRKEVKRVG